MAWTYTNTPGVVSPNYRKFQIANGLGPRTVIVKIAKTNMTDTELNTIVDAMTQRTGNDDAFTVGGFGTADGSAFVSGTTDVVFVALQGTGTITADGSDAYGVTGAVTTVEAVFVANK